MTATYHAVLYSDAYGVPFQGPRCSSRECAISTVKPLDGTTVLGLVELDEEPGTALAFWMRHRGLRTSSTAIPTNTTNRGSMDNITINANSVNIYNGPNSPTEIAGLFEAAASSAPILLADSCQGRAAQPRFTKVRADRTHVPAGEACSDHVAVIDNHSGLMFAVESLGDPSSPDDGMSQEACIQRCRDLRLLDFDDWTLATREQAVSLIDDTRHEPAIDTDAFPGIKPRWHWTSTAAAWSSASAWGVYFDVGYVHSGRRDGSGIALAVRRAGQ